MKAVYTHTVIKRTHTYISIKNICKILRKISTLQNITLILNKRLYNIFIK